MGKAMTNGKRFAAVMHMGTFLFACAVVVMRHPDSLFHPQFFAEDGAIWFAEAYNWGAWKAMVWTYNGYFQLLPRLAAGLALLAPLRLAPLIQNLIAIAVQALPVSLLLSKRSSTWGPLRFRISLAMVYLLLPNTREIMGTITESQWVLALCAFLLLVGVSPDSPRERALDLVIYALCGFTGPFCLFLLPIVLLRERDDWRRVIVATLLTTSIVQAAALLTHDSSRYRPMLGVSVNLFFRILSGQIYLGTLLGLNGFSLRMPTLVAVLIALGGSAILVIAGFLSPIMRRFIYLSGIVFIASLAHPIVKEIYGLTAWEVLAQAPGNHYWLLPSLAFAWSICWCLRSHRQTVQIVATCAAFLMVVGILRDFRYPALPDAKFDSYASQLAASPKNATITIPENPTGWRLQLVRR